MTLVSLVVQTINMKVCDMSAITIARDNINMLLEAAAEIEDRERSLSDPDLSDHHYASNASNSSLSEKKTKSNKQIEQRLSHNLSEKVRRAHLRTALEDLKNILSINDGVELNRHTTVGLLNAAFAFIQNLKESARKLWMEKQDLLMEETKLKNQFDQLSAGSQCSAQNQVNQLSAGSRCSAQTDSGTSKGSSESSRYWEQFIQMTQLLPIDTSLS